MSVSTGFELANLLAILSVGRFPRWRRQVDTGGDDDYSGLPKTQAAGVSFTTDQPNGGSVVALYLVALREVIHARTCRISITTSLAGVTYTVTVGGNVVSVVAATSTAAGIIAQFVAAITPAVAALVTFTAVDADGDGTVDTLRVRGLAEADFTIGISAGAGGAIACDADASGANVRVYFSPRRPYTDEGITGTVTEPAFWTKNPDGDELVDYRGTNRRAFPAGFSRGYIELLNITHPGGDLAGANATLTWGAGGGVWWAPTIQEV